MDKEMMEKSTLVSQKEGAKINKAINVMSAMIELELEKADVVE